MKKEETKHEVQQPVMLPRPIDTETFKIIEETAFADAKNSYINEKQFLIAYKERLRNLMESYAMGIFDTVTPEPLPEQEQQELPEETIEDEEVEEEDDGELLDE